MRQLEKDCHCSIDIPSRCVAFGVRMCVCVCVCVCVRGCMLRLLLPWLQILTCNLIHHHSRAHRDAPPGANVTAQSTSAGIDVLTSRLAHLLGETPTVRHTLRQCMPVCLA